MGFAQELKDFVGAVEKGYKMMAPTPAEVRQRELNFAREQEKYRREEFERERGKGSASAVGSGDRSGLTPIEGEPAEVREEFIKTVSAGDEEGRKITNPVALDALRAYGQRESGWDPMKVVGRWEDTSEKGKPGTSGGALSWRNERHDKMLDFMKKHGGSPVAAQAKFFLQEDPKLVELLEKAKTPEDANRLMANAWRFAGYDRSGGEFGKRLALTRSYSSRRVAPEVVPIVPAGAIPVPPRRPAMTTSAVDLGPDAVAAPLPAQAIAYQPLDEEDYLQPTVYAARGGLVPAYADGGLIDDTDSDEMSDEDAQKYLDTPLAYVQLGARKGLDQIQNRFGLKSGAVPEESPRAQEGGRALAANTGAPNPNDVATMMNAADPERKLSEDQRAVNGWANMIKYYTDRGNPQAVANAGAAMLMHSKRVSQQAGAMALTALEKGDFNTAAKAIQAAYNTFPNGESVRVNAAGDDGVEYEVVTSKGIKGGKVTPEELKELATGMLNGTQWFQHATQLTQGAKPADLAKQRRSKARSEFEAEEMDEKGFIGTLSEEGKKKFAKMDPADKKEFMQRHLRESENAAKQERFNERNALAAERDEIRAGRVKERDYQKDDMTLFKEALKQKRWDITRDQVMTNFERTAALKERDLSDRNTRHRESLEARQKRYDDIDKRIMERTRGIGAKGERTTAKERAAEREQTALERDVATREGAVTREMSIGDDGELVPSFPQRTAVSAIRGGAGYRQLGKEGAALPEGDLEAIAEKVNTTFKDETVTPAEKLWLTQATADIRSSQTERFTTDSALDMIKSAVKSPSEPVVDPRTGMVTIRPDLPPVYLSERSIIALAQMRQRARETARKPTAAPAVPGVSAPTLRTATGERERAELQATGLRERQLRSELGEAYEPGMTVPEMEAALLEQRSRLSRQRRAIDLENWEESQRRAAEQRRRQRGVGNLR